MATDLAANVVLCGTYRVVRTIGRGGMGEVYEVQHLRTKASLALKILLADSGLSRQAIDRFRREAEITSNLNHPNIVRVFDFDSLGEGRPFLVMELLEGRELTRLLRPRVPLPPSKVASVVKQIALGLSAAHERGIVHRDLKPSNVFMTTVPGSSRELVKLLDFGISKVRDGAGDPTRTDTIMGTPHYMSPEQANGRAGEATGRTDQFALAAIAYEMLSGHRAFPGDEPVSVLYRVVHERPPKLRSRVPGLPRALEAVVNRGLAKHPDGRFPTIEAFAQAFVRAAGHSAEVETREQGSASVQMRLPEVPVVKGLHSTTLSWITNPPGGPKGDSVRTSARRGRRLVVPAAMVVAAIVVVALRVHGGTPSVVVRPMAGPVSPMAMERTRNPGSQPTPNLSVLPQRDPEKVERSGAVAPAPVARASTRQPSARMTAKPGTHPKVRRATPSLPVESPEAQPIRNQEL